MSNESEKEVNFDNLRISQTSGSFVEENHYYPFGMLIEDLSTDVSKGQKYKYNGKELQTDLNYNVEDYGARHYDPVIARWMLVDPLAEKYRRWSPYNYAVDNPVRFIDPDGMQVGNNNQPAKTEKNGKPIAPTTATDNTATSVVDTNLKDKLVSTESSFEKFGRAVDESLQGNSPFRPMGKGTWNTGIAVDGNGNNEKGMTAIGNVIRIESSTLELLQTLIDYGGLGPTGKPTSEEIVTDRHDASNEENDDAKTSSENGDSVIQMQILHTMSPYAKGTNNTYTEIKDSVVKKKDAQGIPKFRDEQ